MSAQYGVWHFNGKPVEQIFLAKVGPTLVRYGLDGCDAHRKGPVGIVYCAFHTTKESRRENQPYVSPRGDVLTWDGRLDNREELLGQLEKGNAPEQTDVAIVMAVYERWGTDCFRKLIGDWALSLWNPQEQVLFLAKDFVGTRHLHYRLTPEQVSWCTVLDPLVLLAGHPFSLNEEWIAGYFGHFPATHLTPYAGIDSVPPGAFVKIKKGTARVHTYWRFDPGKRTRYRTDAEYEERFRAVFGQAVGRRLRSDVPVLSELSGGMDSSCIVCMADAVMTEGKAETPRLDTISYYNDLEPNWDDGPYFTKVEEKRGRTGFHIDVRKIEFLPQSADSRYFLPQPGFDQSRVEFEQQRIACMTANGNRVVLSGIGGDEPLGGIPTPIPELADLLGRGRFKHLASRLRAWSLVKRQPWTHLLLETLRVFLPPRAPQAFNEKKIAPWLHPDFVKRHRTTLLNLEPRSRVLGPLPSFQSNLNTLAGVRRFLGSSSPSFAGCYDKSYPYLDRDLLEFLYSVPRDQIIRPGQRRSLMRRALVGLVPYEILNRRPRAYVSRRPLVSLEAAWPRLQELCGRMISGSLGVVDAERFLEALQEARQGQTNSLGFLRVTLQLEIWLQGLSGRGVLVGAAPAADLMSGRSPLPKGGRETVRLEERI